LKYSGFGGGAAALACVVSHQNDQGIERPFSSFSVQLVLEMPHDENGLPAPDRATVYRLSQERDNPSAVKIRSLKADVKERP
jgi:hypothetical protein